MFRIAAISLFAFLSFTLVCKEWLVHAQFFLNRDFIASNFCINKDKPAKKCHGKCFLRKQLQVSNDRSTTSAQCDRVKKSGPLHLT
ncbi:MAG: hypothetical protein RLY31_3005 [Bacteroidota bacterium]